MDTMSYAMLGGDSGCASTGVIMSVNNSLYSAPVNIGNEDQKKEFTLCFWGGAWMLHVVGA